MPRLWRRRGLVFPLDRGDRPEWMRTHAALPFPLAAGEGRVRVYFSGRDGRNRASVGAVTLDLSTLAPVPGSLTAEPLLAPGSLGAFDDSGVTVSCVVPRPDGLYLYYTGWALGRTVPFYLAVGLAISVDGGRTFERVSAAPILDRHAGDPYLSASPSVLCEDGRWRMWYVSGQSWEEREDGPRHHYLVRSAASADGVAWQRDPQVALGFADPGEHAIGRPHVLRLAGGYHMWFCSRGERYRLGYARSEDGEQFRRVAEGVALEPWPPRGWDEQMQAYPAIFGEGTRWWMLYNGNQYGRDGFGIAEAIAERPESPRR